MPLPEDRRTERGREIRRNQKAEQGRMPFTGNMGGQNKSLFVFFFFFFWGGGVQKCEVKVENPNPQQHEGSLPNALKTSRCLLQ